MPRSTQEILDQADELARRFQDYEPDPEDERDPQAFTALRQAVAARADAERALTEAVADAREAGYSWAVIGSLVGTSGEAARQRYSRSVLRRWAKAAAQQHRRPVRTGRGDRSG